MKKVILTEMKDWFDFLNNVDPAIEKLCEHHLPKRFPVKITHDKTSVAYAYNSADAPLAWERELYLGSKAWFPSAAAGTFSDKPAPDDERESW